MPGRGSVRRSGARPRTETPSQVGVDDVRGYYRRILPFYEMEAVARAHIAFWRGLARRLRPREIHEIGSGIGRITTALAREAPSIGIDISLEMLERAASLAKGRPARFVAADMRRLCFGRTFDLIVAPSDPLSHLTSLADRRRALRCVARTLSTGGTFVLEGLYRGEREPETPPRRIRHGAGVLRIDEAWFPVGMRDLWHARYRYRDRRPGRPDETLSASFVARAWDPSALRPFFTSCGLRIESVWGDFDRRPFRSGARRMVVAARKISAPETPSRSSTRRARSSR